MISLTSQQMIWTSRNQVQNYTPGMDIPHLAVSSTITEWESFGRDLLKHEKYLEAMQCFTKASLPCMTKICNALHLRELARAKVGVEPRTQVQQDAFLTAANAILAATEAFTTSIHDAPSAKDKLQFYRNAAECYVRGGDHRKAATVYLSIEEYDLGARCFRKAGLFDETLEFLYKHSQKISSDCFKELLTVCRLFYCSKRSRKRCVLHNMHALCDLTDVRDLGHVYHYSRPSKKRRNSSRTMTLTFPGRSCWSFMEDIWRLPRFICQRTVHSMQSETS